MNASNFGFYSVTSSGGRDIFVAKLNSSVFAENEISPTINSLSNYPNPFNPETTIYFTAENAEIIIYNLKGQQIRQYSIFNNQSSIIWDGKDMNKESVSSGLYLYKLNVNGKTEAVKKCLLLK